MFWPLLYKGYLNLQYDFLKKIKGYNLYYMSKDYNINQ